MWIQICPLRFALSDVQHFKQHIFSRAFTYQYSYSLVVHIAEDHELLHAISTKSSCCTRSITNSRTLYRNTGHAHTSCTHFNWIFELMSSLRSNYALYRDTMPLTCSVSLGHEDTYCRYRLSAQTHVAVGK